MLKKLRVMPAINAEKRNKGFFVFSFSLPFVFGLYSLKSQLGSDIKVVLANGFSRPTRKKIADGNVAPQGYVHTFRRRCGMTRGRPPAAAAPTESAAVCESCTSGRNTSPPFSPDVSVLLPKLFSTVLLPPHLQKKPTHTH